MSDLTYGQVLTKMKNEDDAGMHVTQGWLRSRQGWAYIIDAMLIVSIADRAMREVQNPRSEKNQLVLP